MSKSLPYFKLYTADFLSATRLMSNEEVGVYIRLLAEGYDRDEALPYDPERLRHLLRVYRTSDAKKLVDRLISIGKFRAGKDGLLRNGRADQEMEIRRTSASHQRHIRPTSSSHQADNQPDLPSIFSETPMKSKSEAASALTPARQRVARPETEPEGKGSAPHRAESPSQSTKAPALPPREGRSVAAPVEAAALPPSSSPDTEPEIERTIPQERWDELHRSLTSGGPGSKFDPSKPVKERDHAEPPDDTHRGGDRRDQGSVPEPSGAHSADQGAAQEPADAQGPRRGEERPEARKRHPEAEDGAQDETGLWARLNRGGEHEPTEGR